MSGSPRSSAYYALPEGVRGIYVGGGGSVRIPRLIGASRMMDMMLTGRTYGAEEGLAMGLSHYLVETGHRARKGHRACASASPPIRRSPIMRSCMRCRASRDIDRPGGYMMESLMAAIASGSDEAQSRLKDFLEKRAPKALHKG